MSEKNENFRKSYEEPKEESLKELYIRSLKRIYDWLIRLDYYKRLGVGKNTTDEEVKNAYENKMKEIKQLIFKNTIKNHKKEESEKLVELIDDETDEYCQFKDVELNELYSDVTMLIEDAYVGIKNEPNRKFYDKFIEDFYGKDNNLGR